VMLRIENLASRTRPSQRCPQSEGFNRAKRVLRPGLGFGSFWTARPMAGYEAMAMIRKGQAGSIGGCDMRAQASFIVGLFQSIA
ncbi:hypothetical protein RQ734_19030, partial [Roseomonas mucosa]|nr:hypothetical protein [Roseomonas mucosa]